MNVQQIQASSTFAAILSDGSVVTWGLGHQGGDSRAVQHRLNNVQQIQGSRYAFAAILASGSVVPWGHEGKGGKFCAAPFQPKNVQQIHASSGAFVSISADGSVVAWGDVLAAVPRRHLPLSFYLKVFSPRMPLWVPSSAPSFNAGVMVIDMRAWAELNVTGEVVAWARRNKNRDLWRHGSQPPLLLLLYDRVEWIADIWNVDGLGHYGNRSSELISKAKILHWTGPLKPWLGSLADETWLTAWYWQESVASISSVAQGV
eukprot:s880_g1.t3